MFHVNHDDPQYKLQFYIYVKYESLFVYWFGCLIKTHEFWSNLPQILVGKLCRTTGMFLWHGCEGTGWMDGKLRWMDGWMVSF